MDTATTRPVRRPSEKKLTSSTIDHGLGQHAHEFADRILDRMRLVGDLAQLHAERERFLQALEFAIQGLAQADDVAAVLHRHRQADRVLAHEAHLRRRRIGEAAMDVGDVAQAHGAAAGPDREIADVL